MITNAFAPYTHEPRNIGFSPIFLPIDAIMGIMSHPLFPLLMIQSPALFPAFCSQAPLGNEWVDINHGQAAFPPGIDSLSTPPYLTCVPGHNHHQYMESQSPTKQLVPTENEWIYQCPVPKEWDLPGSSKLPTPLSTTSHHPCRDEKVTWGVITCPTTKIKCPTPFPWVM